MAAKMLKQTRKKKAYVNSLWTIVLPLAIFFALGAFFAVERTGIGFSTNRDPALTYLPEEYINLRATRRTDVHSLIIFNPSLKFSKAVAENVTFVLDQMSVGFTLFDITKVIDYIPVLPPLRDYKTVIIALEDMIPLYPVLEQIIDWVKQGGGLLFCVTPANDVLSTYFHSEMGVERGTYQFTPQVHATMKTDFLIGGMGTTIRWSDENSPDYYREGYNFVLDPSSIAHMTSTGHKGPTPMLWEHRTGNGKIVVNNNDAMAERWSRGLVAAAYSLVEPVVAWPVINASVFFIDDFPAPIPLGYNEYIRKDYGVQNEYFFVNMWFPDMLHIADKYKIKYTGVFIESYNDIITPPFPTMEDTDRMKYFGSLFLNEGHEIGLHGYNHQSLVFENFDYMGELPYKKWHSEEYMVEAMNNAVRLHDRLFPGNKMRTYVPPSNVLSKEARAVLKKHFPDITVISGLLLNQIFFLEDDFGIADDGLINFPRIAATYNPLDPNDTEDSFWMIINELTLHFVNSHFIHPDDVMDPERGAEIGWKKLSEQFEEFLAWLDKFPLRNMTSQETVGAVQRFHNLTVHTVYDEKEIRLVLDGFYDEAYLLVRINDGSPRKTQGGVLTPISGTLYLLKAESPNVFIHLE